MLDTQSSLLLDTNVWLDYCLSDRAGHQAALELIEQATEHAITLAIAATSLKDLAYLLERYVKNVAHSQDQSITEGDSHAIRTLVWSYIDLLDEIAVQVPIGVQETWFARHYRTICSDYEDCLIFAAAKASKATYLVSNDAQMLLHAPVPAVSVSDALLLMRAM